ncbi:MAG: hypothetical protein KBB52_04540 [Candidatus Omnitrophica bacterium]|nr:hypothetical protein [Candidatus Omnitrophota bacterium]
MGPICSLGIGIDDVWSSMLKKKTNLVKHSYRLHDDLWGSYFLHKMDGLDMGSFKLDARALSFVREMRGFKKEDADLDYFLAAVKLALQDSSLYYEEDNDIGLVLTHENPGMESFFEDVIASVYGQMEMLAKAAGSVVDKLEIAKNIYRDCESAGYSLQTFSYLYSVAKVFGLHGYSIFINNACASGLFAIEAAANQLRSGLNSAVIVAAVDNPTKAYKYEWFRSKGLYAEDGMIRPFSRDKSGVVFGDGGAAIVMETLCNAKKRGARVYAEYKGGGFSLEGWKITVPDVTSGYYEKSLNRALSTSGLTQADIDLINPHGVGMKLTDSHEAATINRVFGGRKPYVSALKPMVGHNLGGSALLETVLILQALKSNMVPPTLNCENYDEKHSLNIVTDFKPVELSTVVKMACGFAGFNGAVVFGKTD